MTDILIAEAVGLEVVNMNDEDDPYYRVSPWPGYRGAAWPKLPPFISNPTYETDGIVLEWVQGQGWNNEQWHEYVKALIRVVDSSTDEDVYEVARLNDPEIWLLQFMLKHGKPGDVACALLAVIKE